MDGAGRFSQCAAYPFLKDIPARCNQCLGRNNALLRGRIPCYEKTWRRPEKARGMFWGRRFSAAAARNLYIPIKLYGIAIPTRTGCVMAPSGFRLRRSDPRLCGKSRAHAGGAVKESDDCADQGSVPRPYGKCFGFTSGVPAGSLQSPPVRKVPGGRQAQGAEALGGRGRPPVFLPQSCGIA